jgi:hypothetical protein
MLAAHRIFGLIETTTDKDLYRIVTVQWNESWPLVASIGRHYVTGVSLNGVEAIQELDEFISDYVKGNAAMTHTETDKVHQWVFLVDGRKYKIQADKPSTYFVDLYEEKPVDGAPRWVLLNQVDLRKIQAGDPLAVAVSRLHGSVMKVTK